MGRYTTDVIIHIDENLEDAQIHALERDLGMLDGVFSACVNDRARHLMVVDYDPEGVRCEQLLGRVREQGMHAELIGL